jgi:hypothetical protein
VFLPDEIDDPFPGRRIVLAAVVGFEAVPIFNLVYASFANVPFAVINRLVSGIAERLAD